MEGLSINYKSENAIDILSEKLKTIKEENKDIVFVCIGTDKCIGDAVAPMIGTLLKENGFNYPVYGTLEYPCHALNIQSRFKEIGKNHPNSFVIAIDACVGKPESIGEIQINHGSLFPGKGVGKTLPSIGDVSIVGIVDSMDNSDLFSVRSIRLDFIYKMSKIISKAIENTFENKNIDQIAVSSLVNIY